ncbi:regulatory helix-turn-helix protein, lysR family [Rosenbergiella nectarea]|uniref:Regulatory helix-turn-helix protein, lysR family n=1 Tax=Rosenbergiella nectarea TaxID=988801 RepID=A0A1H9JHW3_9GAMM|nr:regulatory helix-turn-helix protein, lysR family [Rosenbergiella nectarea]
MIFLKSHDKCKRRTVKVLLLEIPVSTVSDRVAMLEKRLWLSLLQRTTRQLPLTDAGKHYFEHAVKGLVHIFDAESSILMR